MSHWRSRGLHGRGPRGVPCTKCKELLGRDEHLILVSPGGRMLSGLDAWCERCFVSLAAGGRAKWIRGIAAVPGGGTCRRPVNRRAHCRVPYVPCSACGPFAAIAFDNLDAVLIALRKATERNPAPVLRGYNRLGRCVLWSP